MSNIFYRDPSELISMISKLEGTQVVKASIKGLNELVIDSKKKYNKLHNYKKHLEEDVIQLREKLGNLRNKVESHQSSLKILETLKKRSYALQKKIQEEKNYTENLKYMIGNRRSQILGSTKPISDMKKELKETDSKNAHLRIVTGCYERSVRTHQTELASLHEKLNSQREEMREQLNKELRVFQDKSKAAAFYKQSQQIWHLNRRTDHKEHRIRQLEKQEAMCDKQAAVCLLYTSDAADE